MRMETILGLFHVFIQDHGSFNIIMLVLFPAVSLSLPRNTGDIDMLVAYLFYNIFTCLICQNLNATILGKCQ
jgi:hypothetical protein